VDLDTDAVPLDAFLDYQDLTGLQSVSVAGASVACESVLKDLTTRIMVHAPADMWLR
jgi:hypothetical protein